MANALNLLERASEEEDCAVVLMIQIRECC